MSPSKWPMPHRLSPRVNLKFNSTNPWARPMPKNKRLPDELLAKLHGKGTMSEILDIERARLLKQSEQDMQRQLGRPEPPALSGQQSPDPGIPAPVLQPQLQPVVPAEVSISRMGEVEPPIPPSMGASPENSATEHHTPTPM